MFWRYNYPAFIWAILILILCGLPGDQIPDLSFLQWLKPDKVVHLFLFGIFCFLLLNGFTKQIHFYFLNKNAFAIALFLSISYGCIIEILQQTMFIHRSGDVKDAIANAIGTFIGFWVFKKKLSKEKS